MREIGAATRAEALEGISETDRERLIQLLSTIKSNLIGATAVDNERSAQDG
jgi:hypothetical protein